MWYNVAGTILTSTSLNFFASPFGLLSISNTLHVWSAVQYYGLVGLLLFLAVPSMLKQLKNHRSVVEQHKAARLARMAKRNA